MKEFAINIWTMSGSDFAIYAVIAIALTLISGEFISWLRRRSAMKAFRK